MTIKLRVIDLINAFNTEGLLMLLVLLACASVRYSALCKVHIQCYRCYWWCYQRYMGR